MTEPVSNPAPAPFNEAYDFLVRLLDKEEADLKKAEGKRENRTYASWLQWNAEVLIKTEALVTAYNEAITVIMSDAMTEDHKIEYFTGTIQDIERRLLTNRLLEQSTNPIANLAAVWQAEAAQAIRLNLQKVLKMSFKS